MIAKKDYYVDENGKITTDAKKGVRFVARKGKFIRPGVVKEYGFKDGVIEADTKSAAPAENKSTAPKSNKSK